MNNNKPKFQPWNEEEFVSDIRVRGMTPVQRWMYRTLLQAAFFHYTRPDLPDNDNELWVLSGCESLQQWKENKKIVLKMFQKSKKGGVYFLTHKRVSEDFQKWEEKHAEMKRLGSLGGLAHAKAYAQANAQPYAIASKDKIREDKISKEKESDMPSAITKISDMFMKTFGTTLTLDSGARNKVKNLIRGFGKDRVIQAAEDWISVNRSNHFNYPASIFVKDALSILQGEVPVDSLEALQKLLDSIAEIAHTEVVFNSGQHAVLNKMLAEFGHDDVLSAFRIFYSEITDEYQLRFAAKNFIEQGPQRVRIVQKAREKRAEEDRMVKESIAREKEKINKVLEELEEKKAADTFLEEL